MATEASLIGEEGCCWICCPVLSKLDEDIFLHSEVRWWRVGGWGGWWGEKRLPMVSTIKRLSGAAPVPPSSKLPPSCMWGGEAEWNREPVRRGEWGTKFNNNPYFDISTCVYVWTSLCYKVATSSSMWSSIQDKKISVLDFYQWEQVANWRKFSNGKIFYIHVHVYGTYMYMYMYITCTCTCTVYLSCWWLLRWEE